MTSQGIDSLWIFLPQAQEEQRKGTKSYRLFARKLEINVLLNSFVWTNETVTYLTPDFYFCSPIVCSYNMQSDPSTQHIRLPVAPLTNLTTVTDCHHIQNKSPSPCHQPIRPVSSGPWLAPWPPLPPSLVLGHSAFWLFFEHVTLFVRNLILSAPIFSWLPPLLDSNFCRSVAFSVRSALTDPIPSPTPISCYSSLCHHCSPPGLYNILLISVSSRREGRDFSPLAAAPVPGTTPASTWDMVVAT